MTKIYLTGAHSTGKTTLARHISEKCGLPMVTEVVRDIVSEWETSLEEARVNIKKVNALQNEIMCRQIEREKDIQNYDFVSDRAMDFMAYTAEYTTITNELYNSEKYKEYIDWMSEDSIIFFVRPHPSLVEKDGFRSELSWEAVNRIDGMIKFILEIEDMQYYHIKSKIFQERVESVVSTLKASRVI